MSRLSLVLSALAVVLAAFAFGTPYLRDSEPAVDQAAIARAVEDVLAARPAAPVPTPEEAPAETVAAADPAVIGPAVRQYLLDNPQVLEEVIEALEQQREEAQANAQRDAVASNRQDITKPTFEVAAGNPDGDVTLVEFFDYNCGYCKRMLPEITELMDKDDNLRVVFRDWPVLGEDSQAAARVAIGVQRVAPEKYYEFHRTLLSHRGRVGQSEALEVAGELGIDTAAVEALVADDATNAALQENFRLGEALGLRGTPSYVVGDRVFMGAVPRDQLESQIAQVREEDCTDC